MLPIILKESRVAIVILFAVFSFSVRSLAQSQLSVQMSQPGFYTVEMNGQFHNFNQLYYTVPNVWPGVHQVRLHQWVQGFANQGYWSVIYQGQVNVLPMQNVLLVHHPMNGTQIQYLPVVGLPHPNQQNPIPVSGTWTMGMDAAAFQHFVNELARMSFDSNRLQYAQFAIRKNGIYVHQLQTALSKFSFDTNRLELAQYAYPFTIDRQNYFMLQSSFSFQSNFRKLMELI